MNTNYFNTITDLLNALAESGVPAQLFSREDGFQLLFPWYSDGDIVCNFMTYGKLESYGFPWDDGDVTRNSAEGFAEDLVTLYNEAAH